MRQKSSGIPQKYSAILFRGKHWRIHKIFALIYFYNLPEKIKNVNGAFVCQLFSTFNNATGLIHE